VRAFAAAIALTADVVGRLGGGRGRRLGAVSYRGSGGAGDDSGVGGGHQGFEQPEIIRFLRVPLNSDTERVPLQLNPLDDLVLRPGDGEQAAADAVDALTVTGRDLGGRGTQRAPRLARRAQLYLVRGQLHRVRPVRLVAETAGQMLGDRAAPDDVQQVHTAVDGEEGEVLVDGRADQRELEAITAEVRWIVLLVRLLVVQPGIEIPAVGKDNGVQRGNQARHGLHRHGRQHDWHAARSLHRSRVTDRRHHSFANPIAPPSSLKLAGDADDRAAHPSSCR
jgi:hypothetical protein